MYTTPLPKVGRYHTSSKTRTLWQFRFNVCPLAHQRLLGSLPCTCTCLHTSFWYHLHINRVPLFVCQFGSHSSYKTTGKADIGSDSGFWRLENSEGQRHIICNACICNRLLVILYVYTIFYSYYKYNFKNYILLITLNIMISCEWLRYILNPDF